MNRSSLSTTLKQNLRNLTAIHDHHSHVSSTHGCTSNWIYDHWTPSWKPYHHFKSSTVQIILGIKPSLTTFKTEMDIEQDKALTHGSCSYSIAITVILPLQVPIYFLDSLCCLTFFLAVAHAMELAIRPCLLKQGHEGKLSSLLKWDLLFSICNRGK